MDAMRRPSAEAKPVAAEEPGASLEVVSEREAFRKVHRVWVLPLALIVLISVVILHGVHRGEFDYNVDEAQHGVTGLFLADAMHDLPVSHPIQYAYSYYAQYPAVSIVHWPPLFYVFEGLSFLAQGPSAFSARLTVALFAVLLLYNWFRLVEELQDAFTAAVSTAVLGLLPLMLLFEKAVMLEIPSLALVVCSIRYWIDYLDSGQKRSLYAFGLWLSAALLCKQTSVFVLLFCVLTLVATGKWDRLRNRDAVKVAALVCLLVGPFYGFMLVSHRRSAPARLHPEHEPGARARRVAAQLPHRRDGAEPVAARVQLPRARQPVRAAVPGGGAHRGPGFRHGADLRPRRHHPRPRRPVADRPVAVAHRRSRATASTAAAPPTTRASTASTSARSRRCWRSAARSASTPSS